jgi:hypothetical protein
MRIDGKMHKVPLTAVPVMRCDACDIAVTDGGSDEQIAWSYREYLRANGLNTPWLRFRRWVRRDVVRTYHRWNYWIFKTFYQQKGHSHAS